jgi:DNA modification methylase
MISYHVLQGNSYDVVRRLFPYSIGKYRVIITSPPYYGQRYYGQALDEIGHEKNAETYIKELAKIFSICKDLLSDDGSLWLICGDTRRNHGKLMIPHRLALKLVETGYIFRDDIIWYKKNNVSSSSKDNFTQAYEVILFLSKNEKCFTAMNRVRTKGNEAIGGRNKTPPSHLVQYEPENRDKEKIVKILAIIHNAKSKTPIEELPTTSEISLAYGYDPEKYCPTCYRKFKRHATRRRIGGHTHYPIFAVCNSSGKNPGNVWEIANRAHYGNEHFAIFPEALVSRILKFATEKGDWVLDPFAGRGTTGIACTYLGRNFTGIDLYEENVVRAQKNIAYAMGEIYELNEK